MPDPGPSPPPVNRLVIQVPPVVFAAEGCLVHILEVLQHRAPWGDEYSVAVKLDCGKISTRVFNLTVRNEEELKAKILAEITKLKMMRLVYGDELTQEVVGGTPIVP